MSGSQTWREYESDDGNSYSIAINKRRANAYLGGGSDKISSPRTSDLLTIPLNYLPRKIHAYNLNVPAQKAIFIVCKKVFWSEYLKLDISFRYLFLYGVAETGSQNEVWIPTHYAGEQARDVGYLAYSHPDTGLSI